MAACLTFYHILTDSQTGSNIIRLKDCACPSWPSTVWTATGRRPNSARGIPHSAFSCHGEGKSIDPRSYRCLAQQVEFGQLQTTIAHSKLQLETQILLFLVVVATAEAARVSKSELPHHISAISYGYGESGSRGLDCGVPCYRYVNFRGLRSGDSTPTRKLTKRSPILLPNPLAAIKAFKYTVKGGLVFLFPPAWKHLPGIIAKALSSAVLATG